MTTTYCKFEKVDTPAGRIQGWVCPVCKTPIRTTHPPVNHWCGNTTKPKVSPLVEITLPICLHRSEEQIRIAQCKPCQTSTGKTEQPVFQCSIHGECTPNNTAIRPRIHACWNCLDYSPPITQYMAVEDVYRLINDAPRKHDLKWFEWKNVQTAHRRLAKEAKQEVVPLPEMSGRGIVMAAGDSYFVSAYVSIRVLRRHGCWLPIELWHFDDELTDEMKALLAPLNVITRNVNEVPESKSFRFLKDGWRGWQLKAFSLAHNSFEEFLFLDADSYPIKNPEFLFSWSEYLDKGAIFWPDVEKSRNLLTAEALDVAGCEPFSDMSTESGQILMNKRKCWQELNFALHYNSHADFYYNHLYGDKDTYAIAWKQLGVPYARMWPTARYDTNSVLQFDDCGKTLFIHRVHDKFRFPRSSFSGTPQHTLSNQFTPHFPLEEYCFGVVRELVDSGFGQTQENRR